MSIGQRIKKARKDAKLTQMELAKKTNLSRSYIGDIEIDRYNPSITTLKTIAEATGVSASYLLGKENEATTGTNEDTDHLSQFLLENLFKDDPESRAKLKSIKVNGTFSDAGITYPLSDESLKLVEDALRVAFKTGELKGRICVEIDE